MIPVTASVDQTEYRYQVPTSDSWRWSNIGYREFALTGADLGAPASEDTIKSTRTVTREGKTRDGDKPDPRQGTSAGAATLTDARPTERQPLDVDAIRILRTHYLQAIINSLVSIEPHARTTHAARHAGDLLDALSAWIEEAPSDPLVEVALAVYPALADENHWADWSADQFRAIRNVLVDFGNRNVTPETVEKAILKIEEKAGLSTTPFEVEFDDIT